MQFVMSLSCVVYHKPHSVHSNMVAQFGFRRIPHLYNQSHHCPVWFSSQSAPCLISHYSLVSFLAWIEPTRSITSFYFQCSSYIALRSIGHDNSISFSVQIVLVRLIMLSYLAFITNSNLSSESRQLNFTFFIHRTCMLDHIIVLYCFIIDNISHIGLDNSVLVLALTRLIQSITIILFSFWCKPQL